MADHTFELLFLMAFSFHNIEEGLWLPEWSKHARKFHKEVDSRAFHFALIVVTAFGYLITFANLAYGNSIGIVRHIYLGFVLMMMFNSIFPHLAATIVLRKYAPGLITGLFLNIPIGSYVIFKTNWSGIALLVSFVSVSLVTVLSLNPLFRIGSKITKNS
jgi:hypothetical protein